MIVLYHLIFVDINQYQVILQLSMPLSLIEERFNHETNDTDDNLRVLFFCESIFFARCH